jgi:thioredoxin 1
MLALVGLWAPGCSSQAQSSSAGEEPSGKPIATLQEFKDKIGASAKPVVVDFQAEWCGWCKRMAPSLRAMEEQYKGRVVFYSIDIDRVPEVAHQQGIEGVPTLMFFVGGKQWGQPAVGYQTPEQLKGLMEKLVSSAATASAQTGRE